MGPFWFLVLMMSIWLSSIVSGDVDPNCPPCEYKDDNRTCHLSSGTFKRCRCIVPCVSDKSHLGSFKPNSLHVALDYTTRKRANLITTWEYLNEYRVPTGGTRFEILSRISGGTAGEVLTCFCLPSTVQRVIVPLRSSLPDYCSYKSLDRVTVKVSIWGKSIDSAKNLSQTVDVKDCFETVGNSSNAVCGEDVPRAPVSAEAHVIGQPPGKTVVRVTWEPSKNGVPPDWYDVDLFSYVISVYQSVPRNSTEVIVTIPKTLIPSNESFFRVRSGRYSDADNDCACLFREVPPQQQKVIFCHGTNAAIQFPALSKQLNKHLIIWPVLAGVVAIVAVVVLSIIGVRKCIRRWQQRVTTYGVMSSEEDAGMEVHYEKGTVFFAASTEEDEGVKRKVRHLCHVLAERGLTPVYYEYVANDHSADSPSALGMNRWVELQFSKCEFVLFVCTKRFMEEWNGERRDILSPLVYPCRNLLDVSLTRPQNISRYAVLFMGDGHIIPPVLGRFRQFDIFRRGSDAIHTDSLIHYLLEVPHFFPPRVANLFRLFV